MSMTQRAEMFIGETMNLILDNLEEKMMKRIKGFLLIIMAAVTLLMPNSALAEGYALQDWSARGASLAGGMVARGGDASAVAYNPAAITELPGTQIMVGFELIAPMSTINAPGSGFAAVTSKDAVFPIPSAYVTHKFNDSLSFGFGVFSRFGLGNEYDENWFGRYNIYHVNLETLTVNPAIAWRINDSFSVAVGLEVTGARVEMHKKVATHTPFGDADFGLAHDGFEYAYGFNLAAHYRINDQWKAGLTYRSAMDIKFEGEATVTMPPALAAMSYKDGGHVTMSLPDQFNLAVAYAPIEELSFEAQVGYYTWSVYKSLDMYFDTTPNQFSKKDWNDTWLFSLSAEYDVLEWLTLRAGIAHETSPIPTETAEYMTPTNGRWKYTAGAGIHNDAWSLDGSYSYHDLRDSDYETHPSMGLLKGHTSDVYAHSFALTLGYKF